MYNVIWHLLIPGNYELILSMIFLIQANSTYTKPKVTDLNRLLNGEMYVKVSTEKQRIMALYGQIVEVPYHEQCDTFAGKTNHQYKWHEGKLFCFKNS